MVTTMKMNSGLGWGTLLERNKRSGKTVLDRCARTKDGKWLAYGESIVTEGDSRAGLCSLSFHSWKPGQPFLITRGQQKTQL